MVEANAQKLTVNYVDANGNPIGNETLTGNSGGVISKADLTVTPGYTIADVSDLPAAYDTDDGVDQTATITLAHHHTITNQTQLQTVEFVGATDTVDTSLLPTSDVQTVTWTIDTDDVTRITTATVDKAFTDVSGSASSGVGEDPARKM